MRVGAKRRIIWVLITICAIGILFCSYFLVSDKQATREAATAYQNLRQMKNSSLPGQERNPIDFIELQKINPDTVAWITLEGSPIDYPILQGSDNQYYLSHLMTGEPNKLGSIFMDYRNEKDFSDKITLLYGHNWQDNLMFAVLEQYKNQEYYDQHPAMELYTPEGVFRIEFFAGIVVDGGYESIPTEFNGEEAFQEYVQFLKDHSTFQSQTIVQGDDRVITLCTCSYDYDNARYALFGKLSPFH